MTVAASTRPATPSPGVSTTLGRHRQRQAFGARLGDDGLGDDVLRGLVERGREPQHLVGGDASAIRIETILACPIVSVPVLSITSARTRASVSIALPPLIRMPSLAARDSPATMATGTARMSGHGRRHHQHRHGADRIAGQPQAAAAIATVTPRKRIA